MSMDIFFDKVTLLLHCNGTDASTTIADNSDSAFSVTANADAQLDTAQKNFGTASILFDGTGDYVAIGSATSISDDHAMFAWTDVFTFECFVRRASATAGTIFTLRDDAGSSGVNVAIDASGYIVLTLGYYGASTATIMPIAVGTWTHVVCQRSAINENFNIYVDGVLVRSSTNSTTKPTGVGFRLGVKNDGTLPFDGHIDEVRFTQGFGRYPPAGFPVPGEPGADSLTAPVALASPDAYASLGRPFSGVGRIAGTVKEKGTPNAPVYRRVRLLHERTGLLVDEVWSDAVSGAYSFDYVQQEETYTVISYDHTLNFSAVAADRILPVPMP